jgi:hypothetical protein
VEAVIVAFNHVAEYLNEWSEVPHGDELEPSEEAEWRCGR